MTTALSGKVTLWVNRFLFFALAVLCFTAYPLLVWYSGIQQLPWQVSAAVLVGCCCAAAVLRRCCLRAFFLARRCLRICLLTLALMADFPACCPGLP